MSGKEVRCITLKWPCYIKSHPYGLNNWLDRRSRISDECRLLPYGDFALAFASSKLLHFFNFAQIIWLGCKYKFNK